MPVCGLLVISLSHWTNFWFLTPENMSMQKYGLHTDTHFDAGLQTLKFAFVKSLHSSLHKAISCQQWTLVPILN